MGYFSNGAEGEMYEEEYCNRCIHGPEQNPDSMCTVWSLHMLLNYELCNAPDNNPGRIALDMLIPRRDIHNEQCTMFHEAT
jgi:hypothetical protein